MLITKNEYHTDKRSKMSATFSFKRESILHQLSPDAARACSGPEFDFVPSNVCNLIEGTWEVLSCIVDGWVYLKPVKAYDVAEFENIFGFYGHCCNFDPEKITKVLASHCHIRYK